MKRIFYLSTCSTCKRILKELDPPEEYILQDIKNEKITEDQIDAMAAAAGSYEPLFSRRAQKYKSMGLKEKSLSEQDYRQLILEEYTFLKRPVILDDENIFIGNSAKTVQQAREHLQANTGKSWNLRLAKKFHT